MLARRLQPVKGHGSVWPAATGQRAETQRDMGLSIIKNKTPALPQALAGCVAKLERVNETIHVIRGEVESYLAEDSIRLTNVHNNGGKEYAFVATELVAPPVRLAVLAGEVVHHLRSTLDHLVCALVTKSGGAVTRKHQFPMSDTAAKYQKACNDGMIKGVSVSAEKIIRSLQPFNNAKPQSASFYVMHELDIADKHRLLLVVASVGKVGQEIVVDWDPEIAKQTGNTDNTPAIVSLGDPEPKKISATGTVVFTIGLESPAPHFKAKAELVKHLAIEREDGSILPLIAALEHMQAATINSLHKFSGEF